VDHFFLPTEAPQRANVMLLVELAMGFALVFGAWLARRGKFHAHAWCQSAVVLLNLVAIGAAMIPSFYVQVLPRVPARLGRPFYAIAVAHATFGTIAEFLGLYILLAAGTKVLPEQWRFRNYKTTMRVALALWWVALLLGLATYARWYIRF
jgi:uncharacterized membrane protein YozB (DUF420 family)